MASSLTKVQTSVAESSATLKKISSETAASATLSQRVSALEKAIAHQSSMLAECIDITKASLSSLHGKLDEVLKTQRVAATVVPPSPLVHDPSFIERDQESLKLAVTLMITQGLTISDLSKTLLRIISRFSSIPARPAAVDAAAAATNAAPVADDPVFTAGSMPSNSLINLDVDEEEEEEEEAETEVEAEEDSSCRSTTGGDDDDDESNDADVGVKHQSSAL